MHDGVSMPMDSSVDSATQAALGAWKRESEFNHHLAGFPGRFTRNKTLTREFRNPADYS
jgi:hypothetical protein